MTKYSIAIESGGSHCRGLLFHRQENKILQRIVLQQPANLISNRDSTLHALCQVLEKLATPAEENTQLTLCIAGIEKAENVSWLEERLEWEGPLYITSDAIAGLYGAFSEPGDGDGILIGGTGNIAIGYSAREGYLRTGGAGDEKDLCCGYALGIGALAAPALRDNPRFRGICAQLAAENELSVLDAGTSRFIIGKLAPYIFELAEQDRNPAAQSLISDAVNGAAGFLRTLAGHGIRRFGLIGSVAQRLLPQIEARLVQEGGGIDVFVAPAEAGLTGALNVAQHLKADPALLKKLNSVRAV